MRIRPPVPREEEPEDVRRTRERDVGTALPLLLLDTRLPPPNMPPPNMPPRERTRPPAMTWPATPMRISSSPDPE